MKESSWKGKLEVLLSLAFLLLAWELLSIRVDNEIYLPHLKSIAESIYETVSDGDFFTIVYHTLRRCLISFLIALLLAIVLGVISILSRRAYNLLKPINSVSRSIPTMILVVIALIWFDKERAPFIVGFFIVFPILYDSILTSILSIDVSIIEMLDIYEVPIMDKVKKVYMPAIFFNLIGILSSTISLAFKVVIAGEVQGQPKYGIGSIVQYEKMNFNTTAIFGWVVIVAIITLMFEILGSLLGKKSFRWKK